MNQSQIDLSSVSLMVDTAGSNPDVFVLPKIGAVGPCAHCHLTRGANHSGNGQTFGDAIKITGVVDILLGPSDTQDWSFNFLQFANLMVRSALWGGRTVSEGSVSINFAIPPAFPTNPSLDSTQEFDPFVNLLSSPQSQVQQGQVTRITLTRVMADHPNSKQVLQIPNATTKCPNFLFNMRLDLGLTTVFVARDPQNVIHSLASFTWHVIYDANFAWKGNVCTGVMTNGRFDIGPVKKGAPDLSKDPATAALLQSPKGPFYNDLSKKANTMISNLPLPPNYVESAVRDPSILATFYT